MRPVVAVGVGMVVVLGPPVGQQHAVLVCVDGLHGRVVLQSYDESIQTLRYLHLTGFPERRVQYDLAYLRNWSLRLDLVILVKTLLVVLGDKRAY